MIELGKMLVRRASTLKVASTIFMEATAAQVELSSPRLYSLSGINSWITERNNHMLLKLRELKPQIVPRYVLPYMLNQTRKHELLHAAVDIQLPTRGAVIKIDTRDCGFVYINGETNPLERATIACGPGKRYMSDVDWMVVNSCVSKALELQSDLSRKDILNSLFFEAGSRINRVRSELQTLL